METFSGTRKWAKVSLVVLSVFLVVVVFFFLWLSFWNIFLCSTSFSRIYRHPWQHCLILLLSFWIYLPGSKGRERDHEFVLKKVSPVSPCLLPSICWNVCAPLPYFERMFASQKNGESFNFRQLSLLCSTALSMYYRELTSCLHLFYWVSYAYVKS